MIYEDTPSTLWPIHSCHVAFQLTQVHMNTKRNNKNLEREGKMQSPYY